MRSNIRWVLLILRAEYSNFKTTIGKVNIDSTYILAIVFNKKIIKITINFLIDQDKFLYNRFFDHNYNR